MRHMAHFYLHTEIYGGNDFSESISPSPQSKQLNLRFCECAASSGIVYPATASTCVAYEYDGKPK